MDRTAVLEVNLNSVCRVCLSESENTTNLLTDNTEEPSLLHMFNTISSFKIDSSASSAFTRLCNFCVEKLEASYNFQQQCDKSYEVLQQYIIGNTQLEQDVNIPNNDAQDEQPSEFCKPENDEYKTDDDHSEPEQKKKPSARRKQNHAKQTMRLTQFSYHEVTEAINNARKPFIENVECIKCGFVGTNARALSVHMSHLHKEIKERWCSRCNAEFDSLEAHMAEHGQEGLKCQFCEKVFNAKGHLTEHLRSHSGIRPYKCTSCDKCFISSRHLKVHYRTHTNERPYKCTHCLKSFPQHYSLKKHMERHAKDGTFCGENNTDATTELINATAQNFCQLCNKKVRSLSAHVRQFHAEQDAREQNELDEFRGAENVYDNKLCTVCGKQFRTSSKLKVHMRIHTGEAPYKCSYCDKRVSTRNHLVVHERTHTGERPHVCSVCGKSFNQSSVLNTHMKLHTGRPEVCNICDQRFCRPAELRLHMRKHTGEKPFLCTECGQAFIQRSHLMEHTKTHSDVRPYLCTYCDRSFKQSSACKSHIQIHLGYKPYRCNQCPYACRQSYSLTQHMKQHSNDTPQPDKPHVCLICHKHFTTIAMLLSHTSIAHTNTQY